MSKRSTSISFLVIVFLLGGAVAYFGETLMAYYFLLEARWNPGRPPISAINSQDDAGSPTGESGPGRKGRFGGRGNQFESPDGARNRPDLPKRPPAEFPDEATASESDSANK